MMFYQAGKHLSEPAKPTKDDNIPLPPSLPGKLLLIIALPFEEKLKCELIKI